MLVFSFVTSSSLDFNHPRLGLMRCMRWTMRYMLLKHLKYNAKMLDWNLHTIGNVNRHFSRTAYDHCVSKHFNMFPPASWNTIQPRVLAVFGALDVLQMKQNHSLHAPLDSLVLGLAWCAVLVDSCNKTVLPQMRLAMLKLAVQKHTEATSGTANRRISPERKWCVRWCKTLSLFPCQSLILVGRIHKAWETESCSNFWEWKCKNTQGLQ